MGAVENQYVYNTSVNLQINLVTLTTRMEDDFRKIAYCLNNEVTPPASAILKADTSDFKFKGDMNNDGSIDTVEYLWGPPDYHSNDPNIHVVVRNYWQSGAGATPTTVDSIRLGVTQMHYNYRTANTDSLLATPVNLSLHYVGVIDLTITLETANRITDTVHSYVQDTSLYKVYWRQFRVVGKNLTYR